MKRRVDRAEQLHLLEPRIEGRRLVSGELSADIVHRSKSAVIAEGEDGCLWVLVIDEQRRPRGRDPGVVVELGKVHYEQNGLVRIANRRVAPGSLERLVGELTGCHVRLGSDLGQRSRIPAGRYGNLTVEHIDTHYRVHVTGRPVKLLESMQSLGPNRWLVVSGEESTLRRLLVEVLMPGHHRAIWLAVRHGEKLLMAAGIVFALLSFVMVYAAPLALAAAVGLGLYRWKQRRIVAMTHRAVVQPHIVRTFEKVAVKDPGEATSGEFSRAS